SIDSFDAAQVEVLTFTVLVVDGDSRNLAVEEQTSDGLAVIILVQNAAVGLRVTHIDVADWYFAAANRADNAKSLHLFFSGDDTIRGFECLSIIFFHSGRLFRRDYFLIVLGRAQATVCLILEKLALSCGDQLCKNLQVLGRHAA